MDNGYRVYSIYFDTHDHHIIHQSIEHPKYKEKMRIRAYELPTATTRVYLELKKKDHARISKRRICLSLDDALAFVAGTCCPTFDDYQNTQITRELDYYLHTHLLTPSYLISYQRVAFHNLDGSLLRITFDDDITYNSDPRDLIDFKGRVILDKEYSLMEVKTEHNYPLWLTNKLSELKLSSLSFSKYGNAYKNTLTGVEHR